MYKQSLFTSIALTIITTTSFGQTNEEATKLDDVIITAKSDKSIDDISSSVTVITAEEIAKMNATSIKDILVRQAGIIESVNQSPLNGRKGISIRGLDPSYSLILIDGKRISPTDGYVGHSDFQYSWVPIDMIERIEVIKGPKSSIYGSQAIGGVINIITKKDNKKLLYGEIDAQTGFSSAKKGGDEKNISANIGGKITDNLSIFLGGNKYKRDYTVGSEVTGFDHTYMEGIDNENGNIKLSYNLDDTQSIYASYLKGEETRILEDFPKYYNLKRDLYNIGYTKSFENVSFDIDYAKAKLDSRYSGGSSSMFNYITKLTNDSLKGEAKVTALKNNYIVFGAETSKETHDRDYPMTGQSKWNYESKTNAYYIQDEIEISDFIFTLGGRYDDNEKYGNEFSPNIGAVYKIDENQRLKLNYGEGFKAPLLTQGSSGYNTMGIWGNDNLRAETSKSYELAYEFYGQDTVFKAAVFKTDLENMIKSEGGHGGVGSKYVNVAEAETKGFELSIDYDITENHLLNANYTYVKTENKQTKNDLTYKPENTFNIGLTSKFGYGIQSYISANYLGEQYTDEANTQKVGGYTILNAQISKEISKNLSARIGIDNIADKDFEDADPYVLKRRLSYVGLNYKF